MRLLGGVNLNNLQYIWALCDHSYNLSKFVSERFNELFCKHLKGTSPMSSCHPLLISLAEAINESRTAPNISSVSENDPRALRSNYYTSLDEPPLLNMPFDDETSVAHSATYNF